MHKNDAYFVDTKALARETRRIINAWLEKAGFYEAVNTCVYTITNPRVVHLAYHHRKARIRKKNRKRIRKLK